MSGQDVDSLSALNSVFCSSSKNSNQHNAQNKVFHRNSAQLRVCSSREKRVLTHRGVLLTPLGQRKCSKSSFAIQQWNTLHSSVCFLFCCQMESFFPALLKAKALVIILFVSGVFWLVFLSYEVSPQASLM